ncbi:hypothetical protein DL98DRAFT_523741 [Cadophora sp. DSE1049]|nr:hypothetical protein DL98DRAFT_523741 [Cadophora sp. DSE1049]
MDEPPISPFIGNHSTFDNHGEEHVDSTAVEVTPFEELGILMDQDLENNPQLIPGACGSPVLTARQKADWHKKWGTKLVHNYGVPVPANITYAELLELLLNEEWMEATRLWAEKHYALYFSSQEECKEYLDKIINKEVYFSNLDSSDFDNRCWIWSITVEDANAVRDKRPEDGIRAYLALGLMSLEEWEAWDSLGVFMVNQSHLCEGAKPGCEHVSHVLGELKDWNIHRGQNCFKYPTAASDRKGRYAAATDWLAYVNDLYMDDDGLTCNSDMLIEKGSGSTMLVRMRLRMRIPMMLSTLKTT